jgi:hypothetical protein
MRHGTTRQLGVAGVLGHCSEFVAQIGEQRAVVGRVGQPLLIEVMVGRGSRVNIDEHRRSIRLGRGAAPDEAEEPPVQISGSG